MQKSSEHEKLYLYYYGKTFNRSWLFWFKILYPSDKIIYSLNIHNNLERVRKSGGGLWQIVSSKQGHKIISQPICSFYNVTVTFVLSRGGICISFTGTCVALTQCSNTMLLLRSDQRASLPTSLCILSTSRQPCGEATNKGTSKRARRHAWAPVCTWRAPVSRLIRRFQALAKMPLPRPLALPS